MPLPQKRLIPGILLLLMLAALATPPSWWTQDATRVIPVGAVENHKGPANIGQAKHMADMALKALALRDPSLSATIRQKLTTPQPNPANPTGPLLPAILNFALPSPLPDDWHQSQRAPLLIGQLKAIAHPFYYHLNEANSTWLAAERTANGTNHPGFIYPWTAAIEDDANKAIATTGQLKAVFSLRFESLPLAFSDSDNDGLSDAWELQYFGNLTQTGAGDFDGDGLSNAQEFLLGTSPVLMDTDGDGIPDGSDPQQLTPQVSNHIAAFRVLSVFE